MNDSKIELFEKKWNMPDGVSKSAWYWKYDSLTTGDNFLSGLSSITMLALAINFVIISFIAPIEDLSFKNGISGLSYTIIAGNICFLIAVFFYVLSVWVVVPWADRDAPLVSVPTYACLPYNAGLLLASGYAATSNTPGVHPILLLFFAEGLLLFYFWWFTPAFGFVPWTRSDHDEMIKWIAAEKKVAVSAGPDQSGEGETYSVPFVARNASLSFAGIYGMAAIKEKLFKAGTEIISDIPVDGEKPRNGILLSGDPGNGKTVFAEALAGELKVPFIEVTYGKISSQWVGNMPKVISNTFDYAKRHAPCILFVDEIDSFISSRNAPSSTSEELKITNTLLTEIVGLRGHKVILIGATNFLDKLDSAAIREGRFDFKVEVSPPDEVARIGLLQAAVVKYPVALSVSETDLLSVAKRWNGFSVARLLAVAKMVPEITRRDKSPVAIYEHWMLALREVQGRSGKLPKNAKGLAELVLDAPTRRELEMISNRLKDVHRIESLGGSLPSGVLLSGPSGTGKTTAVKAIAKEAEWAFLAVAGPDLVVDSKLLDKTFQEAKDIRPCIIFIDEADEVLKDRQYSANPSSVNKLLTLMDGADDRVKDVIWIAATNNPDHIDLALLRPGRFTEKIVFSTPHVDHFPAHIEKWLTSRRIELHGDLSSYSIAQALEGKTIADLEGVLQYAVNISIDRTPHGHTIKIEPADVECAIKTVLWG